MKKSNRLLSLVVVMVLVSSCASPGHRSGKNISDDQTELVSRDFVSAMSKLRGFGPRDTTVQFHRPSTDFAKILHDTMREAGYGIQILPDDETGHNHVSYVSEQYGSPDGTTVAYEVTVGRVKLGREYEIRMGRVFPIAALSVNGAYSSDVETVDNSIFSDNGSGKWMPVPMEKSLVIDLEPLARREEVNESGGLDRLRSRLPPLNNPE